MIKRGEVYWVDLNPTVGAETGKRRPAVVVSNDINNLRAGHVTVAPLTTQRLDKVYPFQALLPAGSYGAGSPPAKVKAEQVRTVDKSRLVGSPLGLLPEAVMAAVDGALRLHLDL